MPPADVVNRRLQVAIALSEGQCGGDYADACLMIGAIVSSLAASVWPGKHIDRKRFIELWVKHAAPALFPNLISVPRLILRLRKSTTIPDAGRCADELLSRNPAAFGPLAAGLVLKGTISDVPEDEVAAICPSLDLALIRYAAYPSVFYEHVRSAITHEYLLGDEATWMPMRHDAEVSYVNRVYRNQAGVDWLIHFHIPWLADLIRSLVPAAVQGRTPRPSRWWIDG